MGVLSWSWIVIHKSRLGLHEQAQKYFVAPQQIKIKSTLFQAIHIKSHSILLAGR